MRKLTKNQKIAVGVGVPVVIGTIYGLTRLSDNFGWWANLMAKLRGKPKPQPKPAAPPPPPPPPPPQYTLKPTGVKFGFSGWSTYTKSGITYYSVSVYPNPAEHGMRGMRNCQGYNSSPNAEGLHKEGSLVLNSTAEGMSGSIQIKKDDLKVRMSSRLKLFLYLS